MGKTLIDIDQLLEDTKKTANHTEQIEYITVEIDRLLNEPSDTGQLHY